MELSIGSVHWEEREINAWGTKQLKYQCRSPIDDNLQIRDLTAEEITRFGEYSVNYIRDKILI